MLFLSAKQLETMLVFLMCCVGRTVLNVNYIIDTDLNDTFVVIK